MINQILQYVNLKILQLEVNSLEKNLLFRLLQQTKKKKRAMKGVRIRGKLTQIYIGVTRLITL